MRVVFFIKNGPLNQHILAYALFTLTTHEHIRRTVRYPKRIPTIYTYMKYDFNLIYTYIFICMYWAISLTCFQIDCKKITK